MSIKCDKMPNEENNMTNKNIKMSNVKYDIKLD